MNGTEVVLNSAQIGGLGIQAIIGRSGFVDQVTIGNLSSGNLSSLLTLLNWEVASDIIAVVGTGGADNVTGTLGNDIFLGLGGVDIFSGGQGNDRFMVQDTDFAPADQFFGDDGNDVLQVDSTAISSFMITPVSDLRSLTLSSIEALEIVKGSFTMNGSDFVGAVSGTVAAPVTSTVGIARVIGNDATSLLEIRLDGLLGIDLRNTVFENWNDGFFIDKQVRIIAGATTQLIFGPSEESRIVCSVAGGPVYVQAGNQFDEIFGSNFGDYLLAGASEDYVVGLGGNDLIDGDSGNDSVWGSDGNDSIGGNTGNDSLFGETGVDSLLGGEGNDTIDGGGDSDFLLGGNGADVLIGGAGTFDWGLLRRRGRGAGGPADDQFQHRVCTGRYLQRDREPGRIEPGRHAGRRRRGQLLPGRRRQ